MEYKDNNRGKIQFRDRARQIVDFSGMRYGKITPTDIDGLIEYHSIGAYALFEFKLEGCDIPLGQMRALTEIVDDLNKVGKLACLFICEHNAENPEQDIVAAEAKVKAIYYKGRKIQPCTRIPDSLKAQVDEWFAYCEKVKNRKEKQH